MNRRLIWSHTARDDIFRILLYIAQDNPKAAEKTVQKIEKTAENLTTFATGRTGRITGIYEKLVPGLPYILAYRLADRPTEQLVVILHVIHMARDWQPGTWPTDQT